MLTAFLRPASIGTGPSRTSPAWRMLLVTMRVARSCGEDGVKPGTAIFSGLSPPLRARATSRAFCAVSWVTTTSLIIAAGAWSHMPMQGVNSSENAPSAEVSPTLMPERPLELLDDGVETGEAVDDVVAQADGDAALGLEREERVEARHPLHLDPRQAGRLGDRLHGLRRDPAIAILDGMQDVHHPVPVVAEAGAYLEDHRQGRRGNVDGVG